MKLDLKILFLPPSFDDGHHTSETLVEAFIIIHATTHTICSFIPFLLYLYGSLSLTLEICLCARSDCTSRLYMRLIILQ